MNFRIWLEQEEAQDKHVRYMLMKRLGFEPHAADASGLKMRDFSKDKLKQALGQMGFDDNKVQDLQNWVMTNPDATLQNLLDQITQDDLPDEDEPDVPSQPAFLPSGEPKETPWSKRRPAPAMYGGSPASGGGSAGLQ
jgi:hypothetical protein